MSKALWIPDESRVASSEMRKYMDYVNHMAYEDLDRVSEFLVMAATLLEIKARMLLPAPETEEEKAGTRPVQ